MLFRPANSGSLAFHKQTNKQQTNKQTTNKNKQQAETNQAVMNVVQECGGKEEGGGLWFVRAHFHLGEGQTEGLRYEGLKDRMLGFLKDGLSDPRLAFENNESTREQVEEERAMVQRMLDGENPPFVLDTTMAIATTGNVSSSAEGGSNARPKLALISPTPFDAGVCEKIKALGEVDALVANNLQHWLFLPEWAQQFPEAKVYVAPEALGEDLAEKLASQVKQPLPQPKEQWLTLDSTGFQVTGVQQEVADRVWM